MAISAIKKPKLVAGHKWNGQLNQLGWNYTSTCGVCTSRKHYYNRGKDLMTVYPNRNWYEFQEGGKKKTGKLSELDSVIKAAAHAKVS